MKKKNSGTIQCIALALTMLCISPVTLAQSKPADWRLFALVTLDGQDVELFYSASEQRRNQSGHIEVWTKGLPSKAKLNAELDDEHINAAATKALSGYKPPVVRDQKTNDDQLLAAYVAEEIAKSNSVDPVIRALYELDCTDRTARTLNIWQKLKDKTSSTDVPGSWQHVAPETNLSTLLDSVCPATQ